MSAFVWHVNCQGFANHLAEIAGRRHLAPAMQGLLCLWRRNIRAMLQSAHALTFGEFMTKARV